MIRDATSNDAIAISEIYNHYILNSHATFEKYPVNESEMSNRINRVQNEFSLPWLVFHDSEIYGYAYATQWKPREAYARTVETTVYIHPNRHGKGFGKLLYNRLLETLQRQGYHSCLGGIALPNEGSIALHEKLGFQKVGQLKEVGYKFDRWIDVGYWELILK